MQAMNILKNATRLLLGGLANLSVGVESTVNANGEKLGSLCSQL